MAQRYSIVNGALAADDDGNFVTFQDHDRELAGLEERITALQALQDSFRSQRDTARDELQVAQTEATERFQALKELTATSRQLEGAIREAQGALARALPTDPEKAKADLLTEISRLQERVAKL